MENWVLFLNYSFEINCFYYPFLIYIFKNVPLYFDLVEDLLLTEKKQKFLHVYSQSNISELATFQVFINWVKQIHIKLFESYKQAK